MGIGPGTRIGPYEVTALLGEGGMGKVWRAHHTGLRRDDALKVLPDAFASDPDRLARFQREAQVLASLNHPNIAHVYGLEHTDGVQALVMELVEGPTLADRIAQGPIPTDEALPIAKQIAEALEAAHEQGIIHRDLKPANIKLRPDGTVKVLDFGLAKALEPTAAMSATVSQLPTITSPAMMTGVGMLLGTAAYMSPEQAKGRPADKRSDIWAFGCVLYEMLTGKRAFAGEEVSDVLASVLAREPDWTLLPRGLSPVLGAFLKRCLHKDRKQRVGDAQSLRLALDGAFETAAAHARQGVVPQPSWRRALPILVTAVVALVTGLAAWSLWPTVEPPTVNRFEYAVPADQGFRAPGRPVMAFSPDGRRFVYNTIKGFYVRTMGELEARLISGTEADGTSPFFSPDGQSVGYWAVAESQLKRIAISGGAPVRIADATNPYGASWGADGTILFGQPKGIMRVSASGGTPELVIPAKDGEQVDSPQLLPDGDFVLFTVTTATGSTRWDQAQIVVQSLSTGARAVVVQGGSNARYLPTGHLVYALEDRLLAVAFDAETHTVSGGAVPVVQGVRRVPVSATTTATANYGVSNDGALVYVAGGVGAVGSRLVWVDRQGRETPLAAPIRGYGQPRVSPDGSRVAVVIASDIWVWDDGRGTLRQLTFDASEDEVSPLWTADGSRIAFAIRGKGIFWKASDGSDEAQRLLDSPEQALPSAWASDGTLLYFGRGIGRVSMTGAPKAETLLATDFGEARPALSPDGRWLAYESRESGQSEIYVRPFPDVNRSRWLVSTSGGAEPRWAPDGHKLFYRNITAGGPTNQGLMSVTVESKDAAFVAHAPESLFTLPGMRNVPGVPSYDVASDGERFLFVKPVGGVTNDEDGSTPSRIIVVQNFFEELKRLVPTN